MEVACDIEMIKDPETRKSNVTYVARHIEDSLTAHREYRDGCGLRCRQCLSRICFLWFGKRHGNYLVSLYLISKALYVANIVSQFFLMNSFLGTDYQFYGLDLARKLAEGVEWQESGHFPRVTLCDFEIRRLGNIHRHTVQCVLPINMFNEKIYIFLWFWFVLVATVTVASFLHWTMRTSFRSNRIQFVRKFLKLRDVLEPGDKKRSFAFVDHYLRQDGVFIIRLISQNAGELVAAEVVERLWLLYKEHALSQLMLTGMNEKLSTGKDSEGSHLDHVGSYSSHRKHHHGSSGGHQHKRRNNTANNFSLQGLEEDPGEFV